MKLIKKAGISIMLLLSLMPIQIFAHGTEAEHQEEWALSSYFLIGTTITFALFLILFYVTKNKVKQLENVKKKEDREKRIQLAKSVNMLKWISTALLIGVIISGVLFLSSSGAKNNDTQGTSENNGVEITLTHVHGLGYSEDGEQIMIPAHDGIKVYSEGTWSEGTGDSHDYMGFSAVDDGFYSSGHPAPGSNKKNPFGIVKSTDEGETLETLALYGKVDFHLMNAGYNNHTIYVVNRQSNSEMKNEGLYYSTDEAKTWVQSDMKGLNGEITTLAVHPTDGATIAVGSQNALYLSSDHGNQLNEIYTSQITAVYFNPQGELFIGAYNGEAKLLRMNLETQEKVELQIPSLVEDAVMYVAQNPVNENELVITTFKKDVYVSKDQGKNWTQIADQGTGISQ